MKTLTQSHCMIVKLHAENLKGVLCDIIVRMATSKVPSNAAAGEPPVIFFSVLCFSSGFDRGAHIGWRHFLSESI